MLKTSKFDEPIKPRIQSSQKNPKQKKHAKTTPRHIIIKFSKTRNKEEILNASRGKKDTVRTTE